MLQIESVSKTYVSNHNNLHALKKIDLIIPQASIFGLIGLSGAGKSTLLRAIAGLEKIDSGKIILDGLDISLAKNKRQIYKKIGLVFQGYNLLMQRTVFYNIAFPLLINRWKKEDIKKRVNELLELVGLVDKTKAYPATLSGGQKQRVAIARALATNPEYLLLDEVTSALDPLTTKQILTLLKSINEKYHITIIVITHEMSLISSLCSQVAVINNGLIEEWGNVNEIISKPKSPLTKLLLGKVVSDD